jgi:hypothetical protein
MIKSNFEFLRYHEKKEKRRNYIRKENENGKRNSEKNFKIYTVPGGLESSTAKSRKQIQNLYQV